jgi:hypothetical protein
MLDSTLNETQDVITLVDFDVFLESNNQSSESFYLKSARLQNNRQSQKYMKYRNGIIVRNKTCSSNSELFSNYENKLSSKTRHQNHSVNNPKTLPSFHNFSPSNNTQQNVPSMPSFPQKPPSRRSQKNLNKKNENSNSALPKSHKTDFSTDYSYSFYKIKNSKSENNMDNITDESIFTNSVITQKKVINSVLQSYKPRVQINSNKYFTLKDEDPETIRKKLRLNPNQEQNLEDRQALSMNYQGSKKEFKVGLNESKRQMPAPVTLTSNSHISLKKMTPFWLQQNQ